MSDWHRLGAAEVLSQFGSHRGHGLTQGEVEARFRQHGPNVLVERGAKSPFAILWDQLSSVMVVILIVAAVVSVLLREYTDAAAVMAIVVLNSVLGFVQEYRAEKAMQALKRLAVPVVRVRRDGRVQEISATSLVPGDVVLLETGGAVPADGRLIEAVNLRIHEATLTGESEPVEKTVERMEPQITQITQIGSGNESAESAKSAVPLGDRRNMAFMGTAVVYGRGAMVVTETGMGTELGRVAEMIQAVKREPTPMQRRLAQLARGLALGVIGIVAVVFALGLARGESPALLLLTAISMAVAAIPEGLPAVVTITLALGAQQMLRRKALIRKLPAVETLGSVTYICSDKTGTLTQNRMRVRLLDVADRTYDLERIAKGEWRIANRESSLAPGVEMDSALALLLVGNALCNDSVLERDRADTAKFNTTGDPTETALVLAAAEAGLVQDELERLLPRVAEVPFSSERKRMTTVHKVSPEFQYPKSEARSLLLGALGGSSSFVVFTKGAVDVLLGLSGSVWVEGRAEPMSDEWRVRIGQANGRMAQDGMRVLGLAFKPMAGETVASDEAGLERELVFVGMTAMIDPPRPEAKDAVAECRSAGIVPVMITGDHPLTAQFIAQELGIAARDSGPGTRDSGIGIRESGFGNRDPDPGPRTPVLTGAELSRMSVAELEPVVEKTRVYARVAPEHKLAIVRALQNRGQVVAMTGDGVNDAPALKKADIGVAMGVVGTDVAKEAADMVLLDDNFATIVAAVRTGRVIYDNVRKFIKYTLTSNAGEIWVMLLAPFLGMGLPLLPLQILWINLVTDGLPGLALAVELPERDTMRRPPYSLRESIFGRRLGVQVIWIGLLMGLVSLALGLWGKQAGLADVEWKTMVFTTLTLSQMGNALAVRSDRDSLFRIGLASNRALLGAVLLTFVLQMAVTYVPFLQGVFHTAPLSAGHLVICLLLSTVVFWAVELEKLLLRSRQRAQPGRPGPTPG